RCLEAITPWLPVVLALSANSPWFAGELTGMASNRAPVLAELPRAGGPPAFASYREWESWVERLVRLRVTEDYTRIWWDVRPHPALGTLGGEDALGRIDPTGCEADRQSDQATARDAAADVAARSLA